MRIIARSIGFFAVVATLVACQATAPLAGTSMPANAAADCQGICKNAGLEMSAVVVILGSVGCVCEPKRGQGQGGGAAAASGGAIAVLMASQQQQQAARQGHK